MMKSTALVAALLLAPMAALAGPAAQPAPAAPQQQLAVDPRLATATIEALSAVVRLRDATIAALQQDLAAARAAPPLPTAKKAK